MPNSFPLSQIGITFKLFNKGRDKIKNLICTDIFINIEFYNHPKQDLEEKFCLKSDQKEVTNISSERISLLKRLGAVKAFNAMLAC